VKEQPVAQAIPELAKGKIGTAVAVQRRDRPRSAPQAEYRELEKKKKKDASLHLCPRLTTGVALLSWSKIYKMGHVVADTNENILKKKNRLPVLSNREQDCYITREEAGAHSGQGPGGRVKTSKKKKGAHHVRSSPERELAKRVNAACGRKGKRVTIMN